jgi:hypothetical protein
VDCFEDFADVFGSSTGLGVDFEVVFGGGFVEERLSVGCGKRFKEFLVGRGDSVIYLVTGGPESVY